MSTLSGLLPARTGMQERMRAEPVVPPLSRRTFLTGILAAGLAPNWLEAVPDLSSEQAIDETWNNLLDDPVAFFVQPGGALGLGLEPESPPESRSEVFDISPAELESPSQLSDAAGRVLPLQWEIQSALDDLLEEYPSEPAIQALCGLPEDLTEIDDMDEVLQSLPAEVFERLRARLADWLEDTPDWAQEQEHFAPWFRQQESALQYFQNLGFSRDILRELGVRLIEGEHPGSTYYAAELRLNIEEANRRARQLGIPVVFIEDEEPQTDTSAEGA